MDAETHNIPPGENIRSFIKVSGDNQWGSGGWETEACTPPGVLLRYLWGLCSMSRFICVILVADMIACRLNFFMSAVNSEAMEWVPCVATVNGACCS
jgi:hypothetical protein